MYLGGNTAKLKLTAKLIDPFLIVNPNVIHFTDKLQFKYIQRAMQNATEIITQIYEDNIQFDSS